MDIGKRIRQLRIKNDLTLEELASRTELTKGFLSQLERNLASPSIQTLEDITEALGTTMSNFFAEEAESQISPWGPRDFRMGPTLFPGGAHVISPWGPRDFRVGPT